MHLYHLFSAKYGLMALRNRRLRVSRIGELNDPFELIGIKVSDRELRRAMYSYKDALSKTKGLHCFSRQWSNPVLWSHYADKHRGICLGFDVADDCTMPVSYVEERLPAEILRTGTDEHRLEFMEKLLSTKFSHWKYEDEVRVFIELQDQDVQTGFFFTDFSPKLALREVIVGSECGVTRKEVRDALGELAKTTCTFKARPAFKSFRVVRNLDDTLWH